MSINRTPLELKTREILRVENLFTSYGPIKVLRGINLSVDEGEIVTIIGANGAGKTTSLLALSGLIPTQSGRIVFDGIEHSSRNPNQLVAAGLCQVPEGRKIFQRMSVLENLELGAYLYKDQPRIKSDLEQVYALFPILSERKHQLGGTLSGGEQQMLAIGRAIMSRPKLLLLDEPSMGVAPLLTQKIFEALRELKKSGMTILLVEQNAHLALNLASRGYVLELGEVVLADNSQALLQNPRVREAYLGE